MAAAKTERELAEWAHRDAMKLLDDQRRYQIECHEALLAEIERERDVPPFDDRFFLGACDHDTIRLADVLPSQPTGGYVAYDEPVNHGWLDDIIEQTVSSIEPVIAVIPHDVLIAACRERSKGILDRAKRMPFPWERP